MLGQILNTEGIDRRQFLNRPWISLVEARTEGYSGIEKFKFKDIPPNQFRFSQRMGAQDSNGDYPIRIVQGRIDWYVGEKGDSPHERFWNDFNNRTRDALNQQPDSSPLSPKSFHLAAESMYNLAMWLDRATGQFQAEINNLDGGGSGFEGAAAKAFRESLDGMRKDMLTLRHDLESNKNWPQMLHDNGDRAEWFWRDMRQTWSEWIGNTANLPNEMISRALRQIRNHVLGGDPFTDDGANWTITIDVGGGPKGYDFSSGDPFAQLNQDLHAVFLAKIDELDRWGNIHHGNLRASFEDTGSNLLNPQATPPSTTGGTPPPDLSGAGGDGTDNKTPPPPPDFGGGDDGTDGAGGDPPPPPEFGGGDGGSDGAGGGPPPPPEFGGGDSGSGSGGGSGGGAGGAPPPLPEFGGGGGGGGGLDAVGGPPPSGDFGGGGGIDAAGLSSGGGFSGSDLAGSDGGPGLDGLGGSDAGPGAGFGGGFGAGAGLGGLSLPGAGGGPTKGEDKPGATGAGIGGASGDFDEVPGTIDPDDLPGSDVPLPGFAGGSSGSDGSLPGLVGGSSGSDVPLPGFAGGSSGSDGSLPGLVGGSSGSDVPLPGFAGGSSGSDGSL
ncbi:hypothetical protein AB0J86_33430, partial [Micromonospora sp. NPDC049559]